MEPFHPRLSSLVTVERFEGLKRLSARATLFELGSVLIQSLVLYFFLIDLPFPIVVLDLLFIITATVSLIVSLPRDPGMQQIRMTFALTRVSLIFGGVAIVVALLFASNPFTYVLLFPGPFLMLFSFFARRAAEREVKFRLRRDAKAGEYGNLEGIVVELSPYGYEPSELSWKLVFVWPVILELMTMSAIFRAEARSSSHVPLTSPIFYNFFISAVLITGVIGVIVGIIFTKTQRMWTRAVTGTVKLDALQNSHLWFYGQNGAFSCYKLFDRPMVTEMDDHSVVVAHWPASFYVRTSSSGDYQIVRSVLEDDANYGKDGRKVSNKA